MARKLRIFVEQSSQHILLKSLNSMELFKDDLDYKEFMKILTELNNKIDISIHSYVLMPTYFEFLATPLSMDAISKFMQSLGRKYVLYFNKKYNRRGTVWEGRYKASLIEDSLYLLDIMKYIELKPTNIKDTNYSSIGKNLFNKKDSIVTFHTIYKKLGYTPKERIEKYAKLFYADIDDGKVKFITECLEKQSVTGSFSFIKNLEKLINMRLIPKKRGRPKKQNQEKRKKMYKNLVVLDKEKHKNLKINPLENLEFAKTSAFVPVVANEVGLVGATFPIVFTADENPSLISLVSLGGDSLAINSESKWITNYIPMFLRRYPFSLAIAGEDSDQKVVLIDEDSKLFSKSKGKQLFTKNGEQSEILSNAINFLNTYDTQINITKNVAKIISDSGILEDREIAVGEGDEKKILVNGFKVVDKDKLNALSDDILADWVRKGIITMIDAHLKSLEHIQTLFILAQQRQK